MSIEELYNMNPRNLLNAQLGAGRLYEQKQQAEWERARWMACVIINPHLKRGISPDKITQFEWEKTRNKENKKDIQKIINESKYQDKIEKLNKQKNA